MEHEIACAVNPVVVSPEIGVTDAFVAACDHPLLYISPSYSRYFAAMRSASHAAGMNW